MKGKVHMSYDKNIYLITNITGYITEKKAAFELVHIAYSWI